MPLAKAGGWLDACTWPLCAHVWCACADLCRGNERRHACAAYVVHLTVACTRPAGGLTCWLAVRVHVAIECACIVRVYRLVQGQREAERVCRACALADACTWPVLFRALLFVRLWQGHRGKTPHALTKRVVGCKWWLMVVVKQLIAVQPLTLLKGQDVQFWTTFA
ncbi:hypothetical protein niasHT_031495 [Heterodera trifolii]|uniref:Uncharacterized protein n=1 Tax=Heterodera trifolii TaxID=157864 RepID=A0ABD2IVX4_9BILA